jgi:hypothetical protein
VISRRLEDIKRRRNGVLVHLPEQNRRTAFRSNHRIGGQRQHVPSMGQLEGNRPAAAALPDNGRNGAGVETEHFGLALGNQP